MKKVVFIIIADCSDGINQIKFVKHRVKLKVGKREESTKMLLDFLNQQTQNKVKGWVGYILLDNINNEQEAIVLTFWNSKEEMEAFYQLHGRVLSDLLISQGHLSISCLN